MKPFCIILIGPQNEDTIRLCRDFDAETVLSIPETQLFGFRYKVMYGEPGFPRKLWCKDLFDLYQYVLKHNQNINIITIRTGSIHLPPTLLDNISNFYLQNDCDYVEGNGNGVGLPSVSVEVFALSCINQLERMQTKSFIDGKLNGMALPNANPYWPTLSEVSFYLVDHFKDYYSEPASISIEIANSCNLSCDKCMYHSKRSPYAVKQEDEMLMPLEKFKLIVDKIHDELGTAISLSPTIRGELLVHPEAIEMVEYAAQKGFSISTFTNGQYCSPEIFRRLVDSGIKWVNFSVDAMDNDGYKRLQAGGSFQQVLQNIETAVKIKGNDVFPILGMHFVESPDNENTFTDYYDFWFEKVDSIYRSSWCDIGNGFKSFNAPLELPYRYPCLIFWRNMYISANGDAFVCGIWDQSGYSPVNILDNSFENVWTGKTYQEARNFQLGQGLEEGIKLCEEDTSWGGSYSYSYIKDNVLVKRSMCGVEYRKSFTRGNMDIAALGIKSLLNNLGVPDNRLQKLGAFYNKARKRMYGNGRKIKSYN